MPANGTKKAETIRWITPAEMDLIVDKRARSVLKLSRVAFMRNRKKGMYAQLDADSCPGIVELALLAPDVEVGKSVRQKS